MTPKARERNGQIVTFYSYKGGTGRSMALANVGWILASVGKRVLLIDWDLEAPGLHRYFHPFLEDAQAASTPGLIDFFVSFAANARNRSSTDVDEAWFKPLATLIPFTVPVQWDHFMPGGALELVTAGRQDAAYAVRTASFDWQHFYTHGGGVFLEEVKRQLRADYDYVLIDSRTGISDTSGICTVQMPDQLVVLFTLNRQSICGAAAIAESALGQRRQVDGQASLAVWPVPTRVELAEKQRLDAAREAAKWNFDKFLAPRMRVEERNTYWNQIEVIYQPYYAYEEVLAVFGDARKTSGSMLASMEAVASLLTGREPVRLPAVPEARRRATLALFERSSVAAAMPGAKAASVGGRVFISYSRQVMAFVADIAKRLTAEGFDVWMDSLSLLPGDDVSVAIPRALEESAAMLYFVSPDERHSDWRESELMYAFSSEKVVVPVLVHGASYDALPTLLRSRHGILIEDEGNIDELVSGLRRVLLARSESASAPVDPDDPQKGRWGGQSRRFGRELRASGRELSPGWFEIELVVATLNDPPLTGSVQFHLHPTFAKPTVAVEVKDGQATLRLMTYGAFTVGAVADDGRTALELDLSGVEHLPAEFRGYR